jgi:hypothetical protein
VNTKNILLIHSPIFTIAIQIKVHIFLLLPPINISKRRLGCSLKKRKIEDKVPMKKGNKDYEKPRFSQSLQVQKRGTYFFKEQN